MKNHLNLKEKRFKGRKFPYQLFVSAVHYNWDLCINMYTNGDYSPWNSFVDNMGCSDT
jgi:hypothetical protein